MDSDKVAKELAALKRQLRETKNETLKTALSKKIERLKSDLAGAKLTATQLATKLLSAKNKVRSMSGVDFKELIRKLSRKPEYAFLRSMTKGEIKDDLERVAKPVGWRFRGRGDYRKPTAEQKRKGKKSGKVYYENRRMRSDVSKTAQLGHGGGVTELRPAEVLAYFNSKGRNADESSKKLAYNKEYRAYVKEGEKGNEIIIEKRADGKVAYSAPYYSFAKKGMKVPKGDNKKVELMNGMELTGPANNFKKAQALVKKANKEMKAAEKENEDEGESRAMDERDNVFYEDYEAKFTKLGYIESAGTGTKIEGNKFGLVVKKSYSLKDPGMNEWGDWIFEGIINGEYVFNEDAQMSTTKIRLTEAEMKGYFTDKDIKADGKILSLPVDKTYEDASKKYNDVYHRIVSDINEKWDSTELIEEDLVNFLNAVIDAGGKELYNETVQAIRRAIGRTENSAK